MTDLDRFAEFIRREAASYHAPPPTPKEVMWPGIQRALNEGLTPMDSVDARISGEDDLAADDPLTVAIASYHEPPAVPRDRMWRGIEAAWTLRRTVGPTLRSVGLEGGQSATPEKAAGARAPVDPRVRPVVARWAAGLAIAASLVIGVMLGRSTAPQQLDPIRVAADPSLVRPGPDDVATTSDAISGDVAPGGAASATPAPGAAVSEPPDSRGIEPLESGARFVAANSGASPRPAAFPPETGSTNRDPVDRERRHVVARQATNLYLGRAETLLTAFRAQDTGSNDLTDMARWARELLGETRLLLDMSVDRSPQERALLRDIELVLAQISRLGPGAPDFEREVIEDGLERLGTVTRVRDAMPQVGT